VPTAASEASAIAASHHAQRANRPAANAVRSGGNAFESMLDDNNASAAARTDAAHARPPKPTRSNDTTPDRQPSDRSARSNQADARPTDKKSDKPADKTSPPSNNDDSTPVDATNDAQTTAGADQDVTKVALDLATAVQTTTDDSGQATDAKTDDASDATGSANTVIDPTAALPAVTPTPTQPDLQVADLAAPIVAVPVPVAPAPAPTTGDSAGPAKTDAPTDPIAPTGALAPVDPNAAAPEDKTAAPAQPTTPDAKPAKPELAAAEPTATAPTAPTEQPKIAAATTPQGPVKPVAAETPKASEVKEQAADEPHDIAPHAASPHHTTEGTPERTPANPHETKAESQRADNVPSDKTAPQPAQNLNPQVTLLQTDRTATVAHTPAATDTSGVANAASTPVPVAGIAVEIASRAQGGNNRFEIRLDPPELGRIDVRLDVDPQGQVTSRLVVEKTETLDMLRREAPQLERALEQAGFKTGDGGLQFSLRDQSGGFQRSDRDQPMPNAAQVVVPDEDMPTIQATRGYGRWLGANGGVDIRV